MLLHKYKYLPRCIPPDTAVELFVGGTPARGGAFRPTAFSGFSIWPPGSTPDILQSVFTWKKSI